ncbi:MAG: Thioredoxin-disulfide reductase [Dehalococcoidia bacterium]|nr:Thioredoxin-disulfide reductase [Dehalococcoidia bacterium]
MYEAIIVGGGPAGMAAAVYAARKMLKSLLITKDIGGQVNQTAAVENYMGYQFIQGPELMAKFEEQMRRFPIDIQTGKVVRSVSSSGKGFEVTTDQGDVYHGKAVIIATGKRSRQLNVPGEKALVGRGVTYCAICDGPLFQQMTVAVIGGGNSALEAVNDVIKYAEQVYLVSLTPLTADSILIEKARNAPNLTVLTEYQTLEIIGADRVQGIKVKSLKTQEAKVLAVQGVFVEIGLVPNSDLVRGLAPLNEAGEVVVNCANETGVPGLYAAGDVTAVPEKQIVVAAGEGSKALLQADRYLQRLRS